MAQKPLQLIHVHTSQEQQERGCTTLMLDGINNRSHSKNGNFASVSGYSVHGGMASIMPVLSYAYTTKRVVLSYNQDLWESSRKNEEHRGKAMAHARACRRRWCAPRTTNFFSSSNDDPKNFSSLSLPIYDAPCI